VGIFSELITNKKVGDVLLGSSPYGYFYSESVDCDMVFVAGGIGIAPFRSMIVENVIRLNPKRKINLFYSNKNLKDIVFKEEFDSLMTEYQNIFNVHYYLTKENFVGENIKSGRIPVKDILEKNNSNKAEFFICGSMDFVRSYHNLLCLGGIPESSIFTEEFF
jgi:ferredoxin-NADP reductase